MAKSRKLGSPNGSTPTPIDPYPQLEGGTKKTLTLSATTVLRRREPTNEQTARNHPNMVWDYQDQRHVWPNGKPHALIEATQSTGREANYDTINKSGHPFALGQIMLGGSPEMPGQPLGHTSNQKKMLK